MASLTVTISGLARGFADAGLVKDPPRSVALQVDGVLWGAIQGALANSNATLSVSQSGSDAVHAAQTYTCSSGAGTQTYTIGGTAVTQAYTTSDANTCALAAAAINANATVSKLVHATAAGNVVTVTALVPGACANKVTTTASGTGNTAGGATLTGGAGADTYLLLNGAL